MSPAMMNDRYDELVAGLRVDCDRRLQEKWVYAMRRCDNWAQESDAVSDFLAASWKAVADAAAKVMAERRQASEPGERGSARLASADHGHPAHTT